MAYSKKVVEKFENTLNEPKKFNVGRFNPSDLDVGTGMLQPFQYPHLNRTD